MPYDYLFVYIIYVFFLIIKYINPTPLAYLFFINIHTCLALPCLALPCLALPLLAFLFSLFSASLLFSSPLFSSLLFSSLALPCLLFPCLLFSWLLFFSLLLSSLLFSSLALPCLQLACLALSSLVLPCLVFSNFICLVPSSLEPVRLVSSRLMLYFLIFYHKFSLVKGVCIIGTSQMFSLRKLANLSNAFVLIDY